MDFNMGAPTMMRICIDSPQLVLNIQYSFIKYVNVIYISHEEPATPAGCGISGVAIVSTQSKYNSQLCKIQFLIS
jgi:hypothetical protein